MKMSGAKKQGLNCYSSNKFNYQYTVLKQQEVKGLENDFFFYRKYVKEQKEHKDEISRVSGSALDKVREETVALRQVCFFIAILEFPTKYTLSKQ